MKTVGRTREGFPIEVDPIGQLQKVGVAFGREYEIELNKEEEIHFLQDEIRAEGGRTQDSLEGVVSRYEFKWLTPNEIFQIADEIGRAA